LVAVNLNLITSKQAKDQMATTSIKLSATLNKNQIFSSGQRPVQALANSADASQGKAVACPRGFFLKQESQNHLHSFGRTSQNKEVFLKYR
jgi:hypothetical protein